MREPHRPAVALVTIAAFVTLSSSCTSDPRGPGRDFWSEWLDTEIRDRSQYIAPRPLSETPFRFQLPEAAGEGPMDLPGSIALLESPWCRVVVVDVVTKRLHHFLLSGEYDRAINASHLPGEITSLSATSAGGVLATVLQFGTKTVYGWRVDGEILPALELAPLPASGNIARSQIASWGTKGLIAEHWFAQDIEIDSRGWTQQPLPLVRVYESDGQAFGALGTLLHYPGTTLTAALNRGIMGVAADTLWFASTATARVHGFSPPASGRWMASAEQQVALPLLHEGEIPIEVAVTESTTRNAVQRQLTAFAPSTSGRYFYTGHITGYPSRETGLFRPRSALGILDRVTGVFALFDLDGSEIGGLVGTDRWIVVRQLLPGPGGGTLQVVRIQNPLWSPSGAGDNSCDA